MLLTSILDTIRSVDKEVFLAINQWNSPFFDQVMVYISKTYTWFPVYALLIFLLFRNFGWKKALWIVIATLAVVSIADLVSVHLFKNVFQRLRPCHNPELAGLVHTDDGRCGGYYGFVSSHAANFMSIATFLFFFFRKSYLYILFAAIVVLVVGYSRIYLGRHYPADVFGGYLLGAVVAFSVYRFFAKVEAGTCPIVCRIRNVKNSKSLSDKDLIE